MHTELYCETLNALDSVKAIRAIQEAYAQLCAADRGEIDCLDHKPALASLADCLRDAGHSGFTA